MSSRTVTASRLRLGGRALVLGIIVILIGVASVGVIRQYLGQQAEIDRLEQEVRSIEADRARMEEEITRLHDPQHLERLARECLGMVKPGEIRFVVPDDSGTPPARC
jgi:cell division protein FtsB